MARVAGALAIGQKVVQLGKLIRWERVCKRCQVKVPAAESLESRQPVVYLAQYFLDAKPRSRRPPF